MMYSCIGRTAATEAPPSSPEVRMHDRESPQHEIPWPQKLFDNIWLLALAAILFFFLSYIVWGLLDLLSIRGG